MLEIMNASDCRKMDMNALTPPLPPPPNPSQYLDSIFFLLRLQSNSDINIVMEGCTLPFSYTLHFSYPQSTEFVNYVEGLIVKEQQILVLLHQAIYVASILIMMMMMMMMIMMMMMMMMIIMIMIIIMIIILIIILIIIIK